MQLFAAYLLVVGGFSAGIQVTRGVVRGAGRLAQGEPRAALAEVAGGFIAPVASAAGQLCKLGEEVCQMAVAIASGGNEAEEQSAQQPFVRQWHSPVEANGELSGV